MTRAAGGRRPQALWSGSWTQVNHRGARISRCEGPAYTALAVLGARSAGARGLPALLAATGALVAGRMDDVWGDATDRGLRGHARALRRSRITTGTVKTVALLTTGVAVGLAEHTAGADDRPDGRRAVRALDVALTAGCVAGAANLVNLFDVRPGRALKVVLACSAPAALLRQRGDGDRAAAVLAGVAGAALAWLPADAGERAMLGDAGANPAGALVGLGLAGVTGRPGRAALLLGCAALTFASEVVSFSRVIDAVPPLRRVDAWGRPAGPAGR